LVCAGVISRFEGHFAKHMGAGVLAYVDWPCADEDKAERAVRAGFELVGAVLQPETAGSTRRRRRAKPVPSRPMPSRPSVAGSGTLVVTPA
jgi:hypothetical protein